MLYNTVKPIWGHEPYIDDSSTPFSLIAAATTNVTLVQGGPCVITSIHAIGLAAAAKFLKFYDMKKAPTAAGQGTPVRRYVIPSSTTGAGFVHNPAVPIRFNNGIVFTITGASADNDTTVLAAGDVILTLEYIG